MGDEDLHTLTGAYLLDALDERERQAFESHLADCLPCRREVDRLREATTTLGPATGVAPAGLRADLVDQARRTPQDEPVPANRTPPVGRRASWPLRIAAAAAALLAVAVGGLSYALVDVSQRLDDSRAATDRVAELLVAPDVAVSTAQGIDGAVGRVLASGSRDDAVVVVDRLAPAPSDTTYQLWLIDGDRITSAGLFDTDAEGRAIRVLERGITGVEVVGISLEPSGGSAQPTSDPILAIELP